MKVICMYLPQFHSFPENDCWWGKGYTEWTAVKNARPLFDGHNQPRRPLDENYYDLALDGVKTLKWQAMLAKEYGIYGFSIYHYYFCKKTLMAGPLETLRDHPEIDIKYHICWANESWTKSWYGRADEILMPQEYGDEDDWNQHFDYLLRFFQDERYIKIDDKPVLQIYRSFDIPCLAEMMAVFQERAKEAGFAGIYLIAGKTASGQEKRLALVDSQYYFEPGYTLKRDFSNWEKICYGALTFGRTVRNKLFEKKKRPVLERIVKTDQILQKIIKRDYQENDFPGLFPDWDNTPRRGHKGLVYTGSSPAKFERALRVLKEKKEGHKADFVYINAWNEWGEGAYLEPDQKRKYAYLEAIKRVVK